jgi:hypothetical protein
VPVFVNEPGGQVKQRPRPVTLAYVPAAQVIEFTPSQKLPAGQVLQAVDPAALLYVPTEQLVHVD